MLNFYSFSGYRENKIKLFFVFFLLYRLKYPLLNNRLMCIFDHIHTQLPAILFLLPSQKIRRVGLLQQQSPHIFLIA